MVRFKLGAVAVLSLLVLSGVAQAGGTNGDSNDVVNVGRDPRVGRVILRAPGGPVAQADAAFKSLLGDTAGLTIAQQLVVENALLKGSSPTTAVKDLARGDLSGLTQVQRDAMKAKGIAGAAGLASALDSGKLDSTNPGYASKVSALVDTLQSKYTYTPKYGVVAPVFFGFWPVGLAAVGGDDPNKVASGYIRANEGLEFYFQDRLLPAYARAMEQVLGFKPDTLTQLALGEDIAKGMTLEQALNEINWDPGNLPKFKLTGTQRAALNALLQGSPGFDPNAPLKNPGAKAGDASILADQRKIMDGNARFLDSLNYGANEAGYIRHLRDADWINKIDPEVSMGVVYKEDEGLAPPAISIGVQVDTSVSVGPDGVSVSIRDRGHVSVSAPHGGPRTGIDTVLEDRMSAHGSDAHGR